MRDCVLTEIKREAFVLFHGPYFLLSYILMLSQQNDSSFGLLFLHGFASTLCAWIYHRVSPNFKNFFPFWQPKRQTTTNKQTILSVPGVWRWTAVPVRQPRRQTTKNVKCDSKQSCQSQVYGELFALSDRSIMGVIYTYHHTCNYICALELLWHKFPLLPSLLMHLVYGIWEIYLPADKFLSDEKCICSMYINSISVHFLSLFRFTVQWFKSIDDILYLHFISELITWQNGRIESMCSTSSLYISPMEKLPAFFALWFISSVRSSSGYHGLLHNRSTTSHFFRFFKFFKF